MTLVAVVSDSYYIYLTNPIDIPQEHSIMTIPSNGISPEVIADALPEPAA
jgi:hypothetical protein